MKGEKIQALNFAIADMLPHLAAWERDQEQAQVFIRAIAFATEPWWHIAEPQPVAELGWKPLQPVPKGLTNMGPAFALAAQALAPGRIERRALRPAMLLITDGLATDPPGGFEAGLSALMAEPAGQAALRLAIAIGRDAQVRGARPVHRRPGRPGARGGQQRGHRRPPGGRVAGGIQDVGGGCGPRRGGAPAARRARRRAVEDLRPGHDRLTWP